MTRRDDRFRLRVIQGDTRLKDFEHVVDRVRDRSSKRGDRGANLSELRARTRIHAVTGDRRVRRQMEVLVVTIVPQRQPGMRELRLDALERTLGTDFEQLEQARFRDFPLAFQNANELEHAPDFPGLRARTGRVHFLTGVRN